MIRCVSSFFIGALLAVISGSASAGPGPYEVYYILRHADYEAATGCSIDAFNYELSLRAASDFLAFEGTHSHLNLARGYARRHTRPLFSALRHRYPTAEGLLQEHCMHPTLRRIAVALEMLDEQGRFPDPTSGHNDHIGPDPSRYENAPVDPEAYPIIARDDYIARTGCALSADSYKGFAIAYDWVVFRGGYDDRARAGMAVLLNELADSRPSPVGTIDAACMIPAITLIAEALGLLDADGRYIPRQ
jgi:hypothetical protein